MDATPELPRQGRTPVFNLPSAVVLSIVLLLGIHAVRQVLPDKWDVSLLLNLAFIPARWTTAIDPASGKAVIAAAKEGLTDPEIAQAHEAFAQAIVSMPATMPWTFASYALLHGSWMHVLLNVIWLAPFGSAIVQRYGSLRYAVLGLAGIVAGAALHLVLAPLSPMPLIGASAGISAFMAAAARFVFRPPPAFRPAATWQIGPPPPLETLPELLRNRRAVWFLLVWLGVNLLFGLIAIPFGASEGTIAWDAHLGGFLAGFFLLPLLEPRRT